MDAKRIQTDLAAVGVPYATAETIAAYVTTGRPCGHYSTAILEGDVFEAVRRADEANRASLVDLVVWLLQRAPAGCYGSPTRYERWVQGRGLQGIAEAEASNGS